MLFEVGVLNANHCSQLLQPPANQFTAGDVVGANASAMAIVKNQGFDWSSLNEADWLFLSALVAHTGQYNRFRALNKMGLKHLPNSLVLAQMHAWDLSLHGKFFPCKELLEEIAEKATGDMLALIVATQAYNYSLMGWDKTAVEYHEKALKMAGENPLVWYVLSRASGKRTLWKQSAEEGAQAVKLAPRWARAKRGLSDSLLAIGDNNTASALLASAQEDLPHCALQFSSAMCSEAIGQSNKAIAQLRKILVDWPLKSDLINAAARKLTLMLMQQGRRDEAKVLINQYKLEEFESELGSNTDGGSKYISMPLVSQTRNHCVPTVAAMVAGSQGVEAKPCEFAEGMNTRHGTALWQMIDFMKSLGFKAVCVRPENEIVKAMLDQNIPLVGQLRGLFMGHVECVCGYDDHLELFHLRDPMHWQGVCIKYDGLADRYKGSTSLWALIAPEKIDEVQIDPSWLNVEGQAIIDLARACDSADRESAEQAFELIPEEHPLKFTANGHGRFVVITAGKYHEQLKKYVERLESELESEEVSLTSIQAMLQFLNEDNADHILEIVLKHKENLSRGFVNYVRAQCLYEKCLWEEALVAFQDLCHRSPGSENMWSQLSQVQQQLGMHTESERSLEIALEVAPDSNSLQQRRLGNQTTVVTYEERLKNAQELVSEFQSSPETRLTLAGVMEDHGDGLEYEKSLLECIRYFPRYNWPYQQLANWYLQQNRQELAKEVLEAGRELISVEEFPLWDFEKADLAEAEAGAESATAANQDESSNSESPTEDAQAALAAAEQAAERAVLALPDESEATAKHLITESRSRFDELWEKVAEIYQQSKQELELAEDFQALAELDANRKIHWWESTRFLNLRFVNLMLDQTPRFTRQANQRAIELKELLPTEVPGVPEAFVGNFLDQVNLKMAPHDCRMVLLEWVEAMTPNRAKFPALQFERAFLLETVSKLNESERALQELIADHPAHQGALYRLGQISEQRGELEKAQQYYDRCIEFCPSHYGSLESSARIAEAIGAGLLERRQSLLKAMPYSYNYTYSAAFHAAQSGTPADGHAFLDDCKDRLEEAQYHVLKARLYGENEMLDEAMNELQKFESVNQSHKPNYSAHWIRVDCMMAREDYAKAAECLEVMTQHWPEDGDIMDQMGRTLRIIDMPRAKAFAREKLTAGYGVPILGYIFLQEERLPGAMAIELLKKVELEYRDGIAQILARGLRQNCHACSSIEFFEFCRTRLPQLIDIRQSLAYAYQSLGRDEEAIEVAMELLEQQPDNPELLELAGSIHETTQKEKALMFFEKSYELTGKVDTLVQIGRTHDSIGDTAEARKVLWQTLELDPYNTVAMTNLMWSHDEKSLQIWNLIEQALASRGCADLQCEYFLIMAAEMAKRHSSSVPVEWLSEAVRRCRSMCEFGGFNDEPTRLAELLNQFLAVWQADEVAEATGKVKHRRAKQKWIPMKPDGFIIERETNFPEEIIEEMTSHLLDTAQADHPTQTGDGSEISPLIRPQFNAANGCMARGEFENAKKNLQKAIDRFDETVDRSSQVKVIRRWLDADNRGSLVDKIVTKVPANMGMFVIGVVPGLLAAGGAFLLQENFGLSLFNALLMIVVPLGLFCLSYWFVRNREASKFLDLMNSSGVNLSQLTENQEEMALADASAESPELGASEFETASEPSAAIEMESPQQDEKEAHELVGS